MMACQQCGSAVSLVDSTPHKGEGSFSEEYTCPQGHKGFISGDESESPTNWERYGEVFQ